MPSGANEMLTRIEVEGHSIDIPADYTSFNQDENQVSFIYDEPYVSTTVCIYSHKLSKPDSLKTKGEELAQSISEDAEFKESNCVAKHAAGSVSWKQDGVDMITHLYIGTNKHASFYVRVDMPSDKKELSKAVRWSFYTKPHDKPYKKLADYFIWCDLIDCEYKCLEGTYYNDWQTYTIQFDNLVYFQGYQFEVPGTRRVWSEDLDVYEVNYTYAIPLDCQRYSVLPGSEDYNYNLHYVFDDSLIYDFEYLDFNPVSDYGIEGVSDKYLSEHDGLSRVEGSWIADNIYRVDCLNFDERTVVVLIFIADGECCFVEEMNIPVDYYPYLKDNISNAVKNTRLLEWTEGKKPINHRFVYFYNHEDDNMYWDLNGTLRHASSEKMNRLGEPPKPTIKLNLPDSDEAYNWRLYSDADAFAWENRDKLDYEEAKQLFKDMHEKYADDYK